VAGIGAQAAISLGSNLGDRRGHLEWAVEQLATLLTDLRVSSFIETEPVDVPDEQPPYLNGAAVGECALAAAELIAWLLTLERQRGRERATPRAARTLDLDLILYGDLVIDRPGLIVPHPRFRERRFVLDPLTEVAPKMKDPMTGKTIDELRREIGAGTSAR
jgi:2-amino-4-hydroxy-6-hydroxymethyldihydropteridine diphosphokinase